MTIELNEHSYIVGVWFSSSPGGNEDWMACVVKDPKNPDKYKGWARIRHVKDDNIWDSKDEKRWAEFSAPEILNDELMIEKMQFLQDELTPVFPDKDKIIVQGSLDMFLQLAKFKPWMNLKEMEA